MYYEDQIDEWLTVDECAERLGITRARVVKLIEARVLRAQYDGSGLSVQPAILSGWTP